MRTAAFIAFIDLQYMESRAIIYNSDSSSDSDSYIKQKGGILIQAKVVLCYLPKGGVGKSLVTASLFAAWPNCLAIDLDPQGCLTKTIRINREKGLNISDVLAGKSDIQTAIRHTTWGLSSDIVPASRRLGTLPDVEFNTLKNALPPVKNQYERIVIDTSPFFNSITANAIVATDFLVIPVLADGISFQGLEELILHLPIIKRKYNPSLKIAGLLINRFETRESLSQAALEKSHEFATKLETTVFKTIIHKNIGAKEAMAYKKSVFAHAPNSRAAKDLRKFIEELEGVMDDG